MITNNYMEAITEALHRREILTQAINSIIEKHIVNSAPKRLKRGPVQEKIFEILGVRRNNLLCGLVNDCMQAKGYKLIVNRGDNYYKKD